MQGITFAVAVNNQRLFENNFLTSPCLRGSHGYQILAQRNFKSASNAYNDALEKSHNDLVIFAHQDMYFPEAWLSELQRALDYLEGNDPRWGVVGCYGVSSDGTRYGRVYSSGLGVIGMRLEHPMRVQTLDEIVLVLRKSSGLSFDNGLPSFHFYGADICLRATIRGMNNYAVPAFCVHNTQMNSALPREFYGCYRHFKEIWRQYLPVYTSCITVSRFDFPLHARRMREAYLTHISRRKERDTRVDSPRAVVESLAKLNNM